MPSVYKYLPSKYLQAFVDRGELLFRSLSYFRNYEELHSRGDRFEGSRLFSPSGGLDITKTQTGEKVLLPWSFISSVREREIFIFCMSMVRSEALAEEFHADACVEVQEPARLLARVRAALQLRAWVKPKRVLHGAVEYYSPETPPLATWAVPEQVVMRKTIDYQRQVEYRLAFARGAALGVNNVETQITATPTQLTASLEGHPEHLLRLGSLRTLCRVHRFP